MDVEDVPKVKVPLREASTAPVEAFEIEKETSSEALLPGLAPTFPMDDKKPYTVAQSVPVATAVKVCVTEPLYCC